MPDEVPPPSVPAKPDAAPPAAPAPAKPAPKPAPASRPAAQPAAKRPAAKPAARPAKAAPAPKPAAAAPAPKHPRPVRPLVPPSTTVVDVSGLVLGRAASLIAKRLLAGETIAVVHAERCVVTGRRAMVVAHYTAARARGSVRSGPHYPRYPDRIFRRSVRGMLPHLKSRGKTAFARLHVFIGVPDALAGKAPVALDVARGPPSLRRPLTLGEIATLLGARL